MILQWNFHSTIQITIVKLLQQMIQVETFRFKSQDQETLELLTLLVKNMELYLETFVRDASGNIVHELVNGYPRPKIDNSRKIRIWCCSSTIRYWCFFQIKDWNASFLIEGKSGGQMYSGTNVTMMGYGLHQMTIPVGGREAGFIPDGVMEDGSPVTISIPQGQQSAYWGRYNDAAEAGIYDSDYFRMRQMSVGYTFPSSMLVVLLSKLLVFH